jgi:hypothetical protein
VCKPRARGRHSLWASVAAIVALAGTVALLGGGCANKQSARIYSLTSGKAAAFDVDSATDNHGVLRGTLPSGEACTGDFSASAADETRLTATFPYPAANAEAGVVVLNCGTQVLQCVLARRPGQGFSFGSCKDQHGAEYAMMF